MGYTIQIGERSFYDYETGKRLTPSEYKALDKAEKKHYYDPDYKKISLKEYGKLPKVFKRLCSVENAYSEYSVKSEYRADSPHYGEPTDGTNERWPSYTGWSNFTAFVGLEDFFFSNENGLMRNHPGVVALKPKHKKVIDVAMVAFKKKYPNAIAGYSPLIDGPNGVFDDPSWPPENSYLVRLEWLKYWVDWALENCEKPVIVNI